MFCFIPFRFFLCPIVHLFSSHLHSNSQTTSEEASEEPSVEPEEEEEEEVEDPDKPKVVVMMADSGNWSDPSTLEKTYQTVYERPQGPARWNCLKSVP